jgi:hypothetical protein
VRFAHTLYRTSSVSARCVEGGEDNEFGTCRPRFGVSETGFALARACARDAETFRALYATSPPTKSAAHLFGAPHDDIAACVRAIHTGGPLGDAILSR